MSLLFEHGVIIGNGNELFVTESLHVYQVQVAGLAELSNNQWLIELDRTGS